MKSPFETCHIPQDSSSMKSMLDMINPIQRNSKNTIYDKKNVEYVATDFNSESYRLHFMCIG